MWKTSESNATAELQLAYKDVILHDITWVQEQAVATEVMLRKTVAEHFVFLEQTVREKGNYIHLFSRHIKVTLRMAIRSVGHRLWYKLEYLDNW